MSRAFDFAHPVEPRRRTREEAACPAARGADACLEIRQTLSVASWRRESGAPSHCRPRNGEMETFGEKVERRLRRTGLAS